MGTFRYRGIPAEKAKGRRWSALTKKGQSVGGKWKDLNECGMYELERQTGRTCCGSCSISVSWYGEEERFFVQGKKKDKQLGNKKDKGWHDLIDQETMKGSTSSRRSGGYVYLSTNRKDIEGGKKLSRAVSKKKTRAQGRKDVSVTAWKKGKSEKARIPAIKQGGNASKQWG